MADVVAQAVSIVPPQLLGAAAPTQHQALSGAGGLSPKVVVQAVDIAPGVRADSVTLAQQSTLSATLHQAPRVVVLSVPGGALLARSTQQRTLSALGGTGPQPRALQRTTLLARGQLETAGGFSFAVPQRTLAASGLLTLHGAATLTSYTWLVAGIIGVHKSATGTQQQSVTGTGQLVFPRFGAARPTARTTLAASGQVRHPIAVLGAPLWRARLAQGGTLVASGLLTPFRGRYQSARGLHAGRYTFTSARALGSGVYRFASAHVLHGGPYRFASARGLTAGRGAFASARGLVAGRYQYQSSGGQGMGATPILGTPQSVSLRTHDKNVPFSLSFAPDVSVSDSISSAVVTVTARPASARLSPSSDVTSTILRSQQISGTTVVMTLGNANAVLGTRYLIRVVATMASGVVLQETIGDGQASAIVCDE